MSMLNLERIYDRPTTYENVHESSYRIYAIHEWLLNALQAGIPGPIAAEMAIEINDFGRMLDARKRLS